MVGAIYTMVYTQTVKKVVLSGMSILGILVLGYFVYNALRPIAIVNGTEISGSTFRAHRTAFRNYVRALESANAELGKTLQDIPQDASDRAALEELIGQEVVRQELVGIYGTETTTKINAMIDADMAGKDVTAIANAAQRVYGLSGDDFKNVVLIPVTREKMLQDYVASLGQEYEAWRDARVRAATVTFPRGQYEWKEGKVIEK